MQLVIKSYNEATYLTLNPLLYPPDGFPLRAVMVPPGRPPTMLPPQQPLGMGVSGTPPPMTNIIVSTVP